MSDEASPAATIRLDKWLWHARFCKSRSVAQRLVEGGGVRLNGVRTKKPSASVRVGDGVTFAYAGRIHVVRVAALGARRGPSGEARGLYIDLDAPQQTLDPGAEPDT